MKPKQDGRVRCSAWLGRCILTAMHEKRMSLRAAAKRVGMSPAQLSRVVRGISEVGSVHLVNIIMGLQLDAERVVCAMWDESRRGRKRPNDPSSATRPEGDSK